MVVHEQLSEREIEILRLIDEGASDREIAGKLYLSLNTVKWHNRQIYQKLDVKSRTQALAAAAEQGLLAEHPQKKPAYTIKKNNLPAQVSSFIGRADEIRQIIKLLESNRLLTLTGPGGVGKTRLALQVAAELSQQGQFGDGVFLVELGVLSKPELIWTTIIDALGIQHNPEQSVDQTLKDFLGTRVVMLVLDNFEHLLNGAGIVRELLEAAPTLTILCTSREALQLGGEQIFPVHPLDIPPSQELFIQRARMVSPDFDAAEEHLPLIDQICARLDRLPLAIELAAARMDLFPLMSLLDRLEDRFQILTKSPRDAPERHQTLQNAIDWSYDLLDEEEKILFRRLAVFQGSRSIDAVEAVCCFDLKLDVLDGLASLLAKNLICREEALDGEPRYYLLETVYDYTRHKLKQSGEEKEIRLKHAEFFVNLAEEAKYPSRGGPDQILWLKRIKLDYRNLVSMFDWSMSQGDSLFGLRMLGALGHVWGLTGYGGERPLLLSQALEKIQDAPEEIKAGIWSVAGRIKYFSGDIQTSILMYTLALEAYQELENTRDTAWTILYLIQPLLASSADTSNVSGILKEAIEIFSDIGDKTGLAEAYSKLGHYQEKLGNFTRARLAVEKCLVVARENNDETAVCTSLMELGFLKLDEGNPERAQSLFMESFKLELSLDFSLSYAMGTFIAFSGSALGLGKPQRAAVLMGALKAHYLDKGFILHPVTAQQYTDYQAAAQSQLDAGTYQQAWNKGLAMSPDEAIAYALEEDIPD